MTISSFCPSTFLINSNIMHFIVYINILFGFVNGIEDNDSLISGKELKVIIMKVHSKELYVDNICFRSKLSLLRAVSHFNNDI